MELLLIDENTWSRAGALTLLSELESGPVAQAVASEADARFVLKQRAVDIVMLSLGTSVERELQCLSRLCGTVGDAKLCVVGDKNEPGLAWRCIKQGARGFIASSSSATTLVHALHAIHDGGIYVPCEAALQDGRWPTSAVAEPEATHAAARLDAGAPLAFAPGAQLSERQREVLALLVEGAPNKVISRKMCISENTVKTHVSSIFRTLGVSNRTAAVTLFARSATPR